MCDQLVWVGNVVVAGAGRGRTGRGVEGRGVGGEGGEG